jgi:hypothetical protein
VVWTRSTSDRLSISRRADREIAPLIHGMAHVLALHRTQRHLGVMLAPAGRLLQQLLLCGHTPPMVAAAPRRSDTPSPKRRTVTEADSHSLTMLRQDYRLMS